MQTLRATLPHTHTHMCICSAYMIRAVSLQPKRSIGWKLNSVESSIVSHFHNINQLNGIKLSTIDVKCRRIFIIHAFKIELPFAFQIEIRRENGSKDRNLSTVHFTKDKSFFAPFATIWCAAQDKWCIWIAVRCNHGQRSHSIDADLLIRKQVAVSVYLHMTHMYRISSMCKLFNRLRIVESNFHFTMSDSVRQIQIHKQVATEFEYCVHWNKLPIAVGNPCKWSKICNR